MDKENHVTKITHLGYGRDVYEAGKPHFFYPIEINLDKDDYLRRFYSKNCTKHMIDYNSKAFAIKPDEFGFKKGYFHVKHHNVKHKVKTYLMK